MLDVIEQFRADPSSLTGASSGSGQFSEVYLTPCGQYAIKYGNHAYADGWLLYAAKLLTIPEDKRPAWAPVIHSLRVDLEKGTFTALMKAYEGGHEVDDDGWAIRGGTVQSLLQLSDPYEPSWGTRLNDTDLECIRLLRGIEVEADTELYFDMGGDNAMFDPDRDQIVFTDPAALRHWYDAKKDPEINRENFKRFLVSAAERADGLALV